MSHPAHSHSLRWSGAAAVCGALLLLSGFAAGRHWPAHGDPTCHGAPPPLAANTAPAPGKVSHSASLVHVAHEDTPASSSPAAPDITTQYAAFASRASDELSYAADLCVFTHQLDAEQLFTLLEDAASLEQNEGHCQLLRTIALHRLAQLDPQLAVDELKALHRRQQSSSELRDNLFDYLVSVDPAEAARTALAYVADAGGDEGTFDHLLPKILEEDPESVNDLAQTLLAADDTALKALGLSCAKEYLGFLCKCMQSEKALAWIQSAATNPEQRTTLLQSAIRQLTQTNDLDGALLAYRSLGSAADSDTVNALASALVTTRPPEAIQLVASLPPGDIRGACLKEIVPKLLEKQEATATFAWLQSLPSGADLDPIYPTVTEALDKVDHAQAYACIQSMSATAPYRQAFRLQCAFQWLGAEKDRATRSLPADIVALWEQGMDLHAQVADLIPGMEGTISFKPITTK